MKSIYGILVLIGLLSFSSCTKDITVDLPDPESMLVVEGYIENGVPPYVLLTKNSAYFGGIDLNDLGSYFVRGARIRVFEGNDTVQLAEFCVQSLPDTFQRAFLRAYGYEISDSSEVPDVCVYTIPNILSYYNGDTVSTFIGRVNHTYGLIVEAEGKTLTSSTYIPGVVPVSLSYEPRSDEANDSLVTVNVTFTQPDTPGNYARYFTQRNDESMYPPASQSAYDDALFSGSQQYTFPIERGQSKYDEVDFDTYGFFWKGDTVTVKWAQIDKKAYDFWHTLDNDGGDNPFSSPVRIKTNIEGGLGVWCGYGAYYATLVVPE
ncbi:MAG: DUF4249 domain-containing protein [Chitinophagales bacterium]|nr:DUF4249 domain-containing protein [Chitinophagales bacterium]